MRWLNTIVDQLVAEHPNEEIVVSSGVSPSGTYHLGTLREVLTAEVIAVELTRRGHKARHLHIVDDLDVFRKVPVDIPAEFSQYLGRPLCDVPAPDGSDRSYADFFLADLLDAANKMDLQMEVVRAHEKYRAGNYVSVIETALSHIDEIRQILEEVSGRKLGEEWSPMQIVEPTGLIKTRPFVSIDSNSHTVTYKDANDLEKTTDYSSGSVKLSWRIDWPARWSLLHVNAEPFGRDHATKGGSYDTGVQIARNIFGIEPPVPVPYDFIMRSGETKKMSKSSGDVITAAQLLNILPPEIVWFFILRYAPSKQLFFDSGETLLRLFDEFAELSAKPDKSDSEQQLLDLCLDKVKQPTVSNVPFSHLVASYQAALRDTNKTLEIIARTEYTNTVQNQGDIIRRELKFIDNWLDTSAPEKVVFSLTDAAQSEDFSESEKQLFRLLARKISEAPADADGSWFHDAIYSCRDEVGMQPKEMFSALYRLLIGKTSGPRAGWFLSILPRDWLLARLRFEK